MGSNLEAQANIQKEKRLDHFSDSSKLIFVQLIPIKCDHNK